MLKNMNTAKSAQQQQLRVKGLLGFRLNVYEAV